MEGRVASRVVVLVVAAAHPHTPWGSNRGGKGGKGMGHTHVIPMSSVRFGEALPPDVLACLPHLFTGGGKVDEPFEP